LLDIYVLTLSVSIALGLVTTVALLALSRTERFVGLFNVRGAEERPRWAGVVLLASFTLTPYVASAISDSASDFFIPKSGNFLGFVAAVSLVFLVGFLDDIRLTSPGLRSLVFIIAGSAVYAGGYRIDDVGLPWGMELNFGPAGYFVTVAWIWLVTNAFNIIDGRDGVAMGVAIFAAVTMATVAAHSNHPTVAILLVALAGAGLGFLPFNLPPASTYVGDSGAYVLGFVIGTLSIRAATGPTDLIFIAVPVVALGYPILDIGLAFSRRALQHRHPLIGDQDHIHNRIEQAGAGPRGLLAIIYTLAGLFSLGAILLHYIDSAYVEAAVLIALVTSVAALLLKLGYVVTIWNSRSMVWVRQHLAAPPTTPRTRD
jgi:UDP-GlcNAc:undecaprenyl-phosphate GlcNAc-1-phosphate transferase